MHSLSYEVCWFTMYKRPVLEKKHMEDVKKETVAISEYLGIELQQININSNAVRIVFSSPPETAPHTIVQAIRSGLSKKLRYKGSVFEKKLPCMWSSGYIICTVGEKQHEKDVEAFAELLPNSRINKRGKNDVSDSKRIVRKGIE